MLIEKERVAVKKRKEDFMLLTASTTGMDPQVLMAHNLYEDFILDEIDAKIVAAAVATSTSASTPAKTTTTSPIDRAKVVVLDRPAPTQEALSASPNPFF
jgi:hypothetical protein